MRTATIATLICVAGALSGCGTMSYGGPSGRSVDFVASNADSVLLDFAARQEGGLTFAGATAAQQCQIFGRRDAALESLNVRTEGTIRATYLCRK